MEITIKEFKRLIKSEVRKMMTEKWDKEKSDRNPVSKSISSMFTVPGDDEDFDQIEEGTSAATALNPNQSAFNHETAVGQGMWSPESSLTPKADPNMFEQENEEEKEEHQGGPFDPFMDRFFFSKEDRG